MDGHVCRNNSSRLPFIVCLPRKTNVRFRFCFQQTNGSSLFPFSVFRKQSEIAISVSPETWRHGDMEIWRHGDMETWRHGDMVTWRHGDMETWRHGNMETWRHLQENRSPGDFPNAFTICSSCKRKFVISPFVGS